ncbi:hypothetical protein GLOIN_2v1622111 [Rhizophagus irregularis DAOM 181602=DAOM 197198]|nr:hypothetical protein GLOIN_2v1622111 [Rhizophagus irregularis DAOM 181602=DAOM 197198]
MVPKDQDRKKMIENWWKTNRSLFSQDLRIKKDLSGLTNLLNEDNIKYFAKTFGIIDPHAVCIDHSAGFSIWILDNHSHMFCWDDMGHNMKYMGSSYGGHLRAYNQEGS